MTWTSEGRPALEVEDRRGLSLPGVVVRPLDRGETAPLQHVFDRLSVRSRTLRFLGAMAELGGSLLRQLADADQDAHGCWVVEVAGEPVGIGRYIRSDDDPAAAEIALEVADAHQGLGIGGLLVDVLAAAAADVGVRRFTATMDPTNVPVRRLLATLGGRTSLEDDVLEATVPVPEVPDLQAAQITACARAAGSRAALRSVA
jgi:RimJ/RimL family protein N-acetyltransferase